MSVHRQLLRSRPSRRRGRVLVLLLTLLSVLAATAGTSLAADHQPVTGDGSSWAANAVNQWIADTTSSGLKTVFTGSGSAQGRKDFAAGQVDFALSDIAYGADPSDQTDTNGGRQFAYVPIVAGGTSFPYNLTVAGQQVRNLRLSGQTIAKIFTNQITNWNDPQITKDNNGHALPSITIVPVVRSDGSGATAQFTRYLDTQYPNIWRPFNGGHAGLTEYFPRQDPQVAQNGSDGVMNFVTSAAGAGAIGFDEYSYALALNYPVVKLENSAGYYTLPTQYNDAVALTQAQIDTTDVNDPTRYLTENLDKVYSYGDPRTYPLSSYSYMIIPTGGASDSSLNSGKRQTITDFMNYSLCLGQSEAGKLGYSPLPLNLVNAAFTQIDKLHDADPNVDVSNVNTTQCNNPTFDGKNPNNNVLAQIAPQPPACDKDGAGPCGAVNQAVLNANPTTSSTGKKVAPVAAKAKTGTTTAAHAGTAAGAVGATGAGVSAATGSGTAATVTDPVTGVTTTTTGSAGTGAAAAVDPVTGAVTTTDTTGAAAADGSAADGSGTADAAPNPTVLAAAPSTAPTDILAPLAVVLLLGVLLIPAFVSRRLSRRGPTDIPS